MSALCRAYALNANSIVFRRSRVVSCGGRQFSSKPTDPSRERGLLNNSKPQTPVRSRLTPVSNIMSAYADKESAEYRARISHPATQTEAAAKVGVDEPVEINTVIIKERRTKQLIDMLWNTRITSQASNCLRCAHVARDEGIEFTTSRELMTILWACSEVITTMSPYLTRDLATLETYNPAAYKTIIKTRIAYDVYNQMISKEAPIEVFVKVIHVASSLKDVDMVLEVFRKFREMHGDTVLQGSIGTVAMVIDCLASVLNRESWALRHSPSWTYKMEDELRQHYDLYQTVRDAIATSSTTATLGMVNIRDTNHFYFNVLKYYSFACDSEDVLMVLRHMTEDGVEPTLELCNILLDNALLFGANSVLRVLANWYLNNFDVKLEHGLLSRMFQISSSQGDSELATCTFKLFLKCGYSPTASEFAAVVRAFVRKGEDMSALEMLVESKTHGIDFYDRPSLQAELGFTEKEIARSLRLPTSTFSRKELISITKAANSGNHGFRGRYATGTALQEELVKVIGMTASRVDMFYFALVDIARGKLAVPNLAINAVIGASGKINQIDRMFATFQELDTLFNMTHSVHSYNALLRGIVCTLSPSLEKMFTVLQNMESSGLSANNDTMTHIIEAISQREEFEGLTAIIDHIDANKDELLPSARSLRRLHYALNRAGLTGLLSDPESKLFKLLISSSAPLDGCPSYAAPFIDPTVPVKKTYGR